MKKYNNLKHLITLRNIPLKKIILYHLPLLAKIGLVRRFSNYQHTLTIKPFEAMLNVTDNCCLRCIMCNEWKTTTRNELNTDEWKNILKQLKEIGIFRVAFSGGECLLRKDLHLLIRYACELGLQTGIVTNGYLLDKKRALELIRAGTSNIFISVDATNEKYDEIRGVKGAYQKARAACEVLSSLKEQYNLNVKIMAVIMKPTLDYILDVVNLGESLELPVVFSMVDYTPYFFQREGNKNKEEFWIQDSDREKLDNLVNKLISIKRGKRWLIPQDYTALEYIRRYFQDPLQKAVPCASALIRILIDSQGKVYGGCWSMGNFGNLRELQLKDIINSERYRKTHQRMLAKKCPGCSCGYSTNLHYSLKYLFKEVRLRLGWRFLGIEVK